MTSMSHLGPPEHIGGPSAHPSRVSIEIEHLGWATSIQDRGRPGRRHLGVSASGALDARSYERANRRVGNDPGDAAIETSGDLVVVARGGPVAFAVCGTDASVTVDGHEMGVEMPVIARAEARIRIGVATRGWRSYLAIRGGLAVASVLGSRSRDTLGGLGPGPLSIGDHLEIGPDPRRAMVHEVAAIETIGDPIRIWPGPRAETIDAAVLDTVVLGPWQVSAASDRIGMRLEGPRLHVPGVGLGVSEPLVPGAIQMTGDGQPIVMMNDHPTTGGYPVVGVVHAGDLARLAQHRPGEAVTLRRIH